jgi:hypothetical protein
LFASVAATIRRQFPDLTGAAVELLLADPRRDAEEDLFRLLHNTIELSTPVDLMAGRFLGED